MLSGVNSGLTNTSFYKAPIQLLIGNSPWDNDVNKNLHEYKYVDYYKIVLKDGGFVFYSPFFDTYAAVFKTSSTSYPNFTFSSFDPNNSLFWLAMNPFWQYENTMFYLNPFVNGANGSCPYITLNPKYQSTIYFDSVTNKWTHSYSPSLSGIEGCYFLIGQNDYTNGNTLFHSDSVIYTSSSLNVESAAEDVNNYDINNFSIGRNSTFEEVSNGIILSDIKNINSFNKTLKITTPGNLTSNKVTLKCPNDLFIRSKLAPDLDFEEGIANEELVGVYVKPLSQSTQFSLGCWALGNNDNRKFGLFAGLNRLYDPLLNNVGNWDYDNVNNMVINGQSPPYCKNVNVIMTDESTNAGPYPYYYPYEMLLGKTFNLETPKYLTFLMAPPQYNKEAYQNFADKLSILYDDIFTPYCFYIYEGEPYGIKTKKKFWKAECPVSLASLTSSEYYYNVKAAELFRCSMKVFSQSVTSLNFKYFDLENGETKPDIEISPIGLTRTNPFKLVLNMDDPLIQNAVLKSQGNNFKIEKSAEYFNSNVYICNWASPAVQFEE